jgi:hypothetical protein
MGERRFAPRPVRGSGTRESVITPLWSLETYRHTFGWPVLAEGDTVLLSCAATMAAVEIPAAWAAKVVDRLALSGALGPVLTHPAPFPAWIFLTESDDLPWTPPTAPPGVALLEPRVTFALPVVGGDSRGARWIVAPDLRRRWRPTTSAVFATLGDSRLGGAHLSRRAA